MQPGSHRPARGPQRFRLTSAIILTFATALAAGGCVANSSNPTVTVRSATADDEQASFELDLFNPGGRDLTVTALQCEVSHGEAAFPLVTANWTGSLALNARQHALLTFQARYSTPPIEPGSRLFHLNGELSFIDKTGFLGMQSMDLTKTPFHLQVQAATPEAPR